MQGVALEFVTTIMQEPAPSTIKLFNINSTQDVRLLAVLGDSWTSKGRFRPEIVDTNPRDYVDIRPHATSSETGNNSLSGKIVVANGAFIENYSEGGYTLDRFLNDGVRLGKWAREVPELTILHVGACDIVNERKYESNTIKKQFVKDVADFMDEWPKKARETLDKEPSSLHKRHLKNTFDHRLPKHQWLIVRIPVWDASNGIRYMDNKVFGDLRRKANSGLADARTRFWLEHRAVVLPIDLQSPQFIPGQVHLTDQYQREFNRQVLSAAAKIVCEFCHWTRERLVSREHNQLVDRSRRCAKDALAPYRFII